MRGRISIGVAIVIVALALVVIGMVALAQEKPMAPPPPQMRGPGMMGPGPGMMGGPGMGKMCPMHAGMMAGMMGRSSMIASGNYIYVMAGNMLMKYDQNLRLVKEVEIKMDTAKMREMMQECMKSCPMPWPGMPGPPGMPGAGMGPAPMGPPEPAEPAK